MRSTRIAVACDLLEENWPSMALVADMLVNNLEKDHSDYITATRICPPMRRRFSSESTATGKLFNADRFVNRFWDYPRVARRVKDEFDLFHLVDHSYGQLLHELPPKRTIVTCHDLDTFQCLLNPAQERRSVFFRKMMERTLSGFRQAAWVTCDSVATRDELLAHDLVPAERTVVVPNGVHPSCLPEPNPPADAEADRLVGIELRGKSRELSDGKGLDILHVGSTISRKRIDILLRVFASVKALFPNARLIRVGGAFTSDQAKLVEELNLGESILVLPHIDRDALAAVYRRAALVLLPSEREGFGLPVVEAMACGTPVVASDLNVLREVGGEAATYCPVGDVNAWSESVIALLEERSRSEVRDQRSEVRSQRSEVGYSESWTRRREAGLAQAAKFSWAEYARKMVQIYMSVVDGKKSVVSGG